MERDVLVRLRSTNSRLTNCSLDLAIPPLFILLPTYYNSLDDVCPISKIAFQNRIGIKVRGGQFPRESVRRSVVLG